MTARSALISGATGFVGTALTRLLCQEGVDVHVLARKSSDLSRLNGLPVRVHHGDVVDAASVAQAVQRAAASAGGRRSGLLVVHAAAVISYKTRDRQLQWAVNVEGTRHVLQACRATAVERLLHISSVVAVGAAPGLARLDERAPYAEAGLCSDYMRTKRAAEELVLSAADRLDVVVTNPGAIFGPDARGPNTLKFLRKLSQGKLGPFAPPGALSVVGVEDVAKGCWLALQHGRRGQRYLLTESCLESLELFQMAARILNVRGPRWTAPKWLWSSIAVGSGLVDLVWPLELAAPQALRMLGARWAMDSAKARTELGWQPEKFESVLARTVADLRAQGQLR